MGLREEDLGFPPPPPPTGVHVCPPPPQFFIKIVVNGEQYRNFYRKAPTCTLPGLFCNDLSHTVDRENFTVKKFSPVA